MSRALRGAGEAGDGSGVVLSRSLRWFAYTSAAAASTGTLLFCYRTTLADFKPAMITAHELTGDAVVLAMGIYLWLHVGRTWRLRRGRAVSWWSGLVGGLCWMVSIVTGVYAQVWGMGESTLLWWVHGLASFVAIVVVCFHAAYGFRASVIQMRGTV